VAITVVLARRRERRWLASILEAETRSGGISGVELAQLERPGRRRRARREMRRRAGARAASLLHRLQREQVTLAMIRSKVATDDDPALQRQRELCHSLRVALSAMPGAASAETGRPAG
jgi:hypothetical protein